MELSLSKESGLKLYSNLKNIENEHPIDHPADVLSRSIKKLNLSLTNLLNTRYSSAFDDNKGKAICDHFLEVDSFYDRLFLIMKALSPVNEADNKDATLWLKKHNKEAYTKFVSSTAKAHQRIRKVSNGIKHDSLSVEYLTLTDHRNRKVDGFYFAKTTGKDDLQMACQDIHDDYKGSSTAISYDYFIRYTAGFVASCLFHVNKIFFNNVKCSKEKFLPSYQFFDKQKDIGDLIFPDEYGCELAELSVKNLSIVVKFPSKIKKNNETDNIIEVQPTLKVNMRTGQAHNRFPYHSLIWN
jgi:hypothetical protein